MPRAKTTRPAKTAPPPAPAKPTRQALAEPAPPPPTEPVGKVVPLPNPVVVQVWRAVQRHGRDLAIVGLLALAALSILGLMGDSTGVVGALAGALRAGLGWGAWVVPAVCFWAAYVLVRRGMNQPVAVSFDRALWLELGLFALLGLLNVAHSGNIALATAGEGGGLVGWGLGFVVRQLAPPPADALVFGTVGLLSLFFTVPATRQRFEAFLAWVRTPAWETAPASAAPASTAPRPTAKPPAKPRQLTLDEAPKPTERRKPKLAPHERIRVQVETADEPPKRPLKQKKRPDTLPALDLLDDGTLSRPSQKDIDETASILLKTLREFGVVVHPEIGARVGPTVTQYQVRPGFVEKTSPEGLRQWKIRVAQIAGLQKDLALALAANTIRIEAPVPGTNYVGIEVPHNRTSRVGLRPLLEADSFRKLSAPLAIALGRDVSGAAVAADLGRMPHLLIAGTTGSGKSVCITALTLSLVMNNTPDTLRLVMLDPKRVELMRFNGLPHLFGKVETELDRMIGSLKWTVREMERRYRLFEQAGVRNLDGYLGYAKGNPSAEALPRIVVLVDELADLMMQAPDETERTIVRLAQMARATGIHLVVATQRPSTDVVTGLIKANFPARISFAVASGVDSRVVLDQPGAESLLGKGDMLFLSPEATALQRLQGVFVSDRELERVMDFWAEQSGETEDPAPTPESAPAEAPRTESARMVSVLAGSQPAPPAAPWDDMLAREAALAGKDEHLEQAIAIVKKHGTASTSLLQRKLRLGYPRAAALMDELKNMGLIGREQAGGKTREVFVRPDDDPIGDRAARILGEDDA